MLTSAELRKVEKPVEEVDPGPKNKKELEEDQRRYLEQPPDRSLLELGAWGGWNSGFFIQKARRLVKNHVEKQAGF